MGASLLGFGRTLTVTVIPETADGPSQAWSFDVTTQQSESLPGQAYRHPLQNGEEGIVDAVRREPPEFVVSGLATDTPIRALSPRRFAGAAQLYAQIKQIRAQEVPVTVITSWAGTLTSRWPESIQGDHSTASGASIEIGINFVRMRLNYLQLTAAQVDSDVLLVGSQTVQGQQF